jgi:hypothetical protein
MTKSKTESFDMAGSENRNVILSFHARYAHPYDDTTVVSVFHRTTNGQISVLLERGDFRDLAAWMAQEHSPLNDDPPVSFDRRVDGQGIPVYYRAVQSNGWQFCFHSLQTEMEIIDRFDGRLRFVLKWNGSGISRSLILSREAADRLRAWIADTDANGWAGWRSGRTGAVA